MNAVTSQTHEDDIQGVENLVRRTGAAAVVSPRDAGARGGARIDAVDGLDVVLGRRGVRALEAPGHPVGGTCYPAEGFVITGDLLFVGGRGRIDFPGGDTAAMCASRKRLMALPEETPIYPGHELRGEWTRLIIGPALPPGRGRVASRGGAAPRAIRDPDGN